MKVELLRYTPDPEDAIELAARLCYNSTKSATKEGQRKFISGIVKRGHTGVVEPASAMFKISEVSRAFTHELVRHRLMSFCQRSQRYCKEDGFKYVIPATIAKDNVSDGLHTSLLDRYEHLMGEIEEVYNLLVDSGIPKEDARYVLPNACYTEITVTANFREWLHFLELRLSPRAQWEIREVAREILKQLYEIAPSVFGHLYEQTFGEPK